MLYKKLNVSPIISASCKFVPASTVGTHDKIVQAPPIPAMPATTYLI